MDYAKIDAGLAGVLSEPTEPGREFLVTVRTTRPLTPDEQTEFVRLGGTAADSKLPVLTARTSYQGVNELSRKAWVRLVTLSRALRPT